MGLLENRGLHIFMEVVYITERPKLRRFHQFLCKQRSVFFIFGRIAFNLLDLTNFSLSWPSGWAHVARCFTINGFCSLTNGHFVVWWCIKPFSISGFESDNETKSYQRFFLPKRSNYADRLRKSLWFGFMALSLQNFISIWLGHNCMICQRKLRWESVLSIL